MERCGRPTPRPLIEAGEAYFLHSYEYVADDGHHVVAMTDHGGA
jgi:glutamine amidotransferase